MSASNMTKDLVLLLVAFAAQTGLRADEFRPVPIFEGKSIPDPPRQKEPWTPPQTTLPRFLLTATATLFDQGMADPRGCEYREVEIGEGRILKTRGFVLPQQEGETRRFAVSWDGVVYPALSVGPVADLDKDIRALAQSMERDRKAAAAQAQNAFRNTGGFTTAFQRGRISDGEPSGVEGRSAVKLCLLLRLGRADLAEALFTAGTTWKPEIRGRDLTNYQINFLSLATDWAAAVFLRLVSAHLRADDVIALDAARRLSAFAKEAETHAAAMGFPRAQQPVDGETPPYILFLRQLPELLADQERRAKEPARGPIPKHGGDPSARIAALIHDFDEIDSPMYPGGGYIAGSPRVQAMIAEGEPAVEPLLTALETDMRLTRSVSEGRSRSINRTIHPVLEAELAALEGILKTAEFANSRYRLRPDDRAGRKALAQSLRAYWLKNRAITLPDRWYAILRDDAAGQDRWFAAAGGIVQSRNDDSLPSFGTFISGTRPRRPDAPPMKGEPLRSRRDPSVSELLARRATELARTANPLQMPDIALVRACELALVLDRWDGQAALPVLPMLMTQCLTGIEFRRQRGPQMEQHLARFVAEFTLLRARAGERKTLDEYAAWIRKAVPKELERQSVICFEPMWTHPDHPAIAEAARWLFNDPKSPWLPSLLARETRMMFFFFHDGNFFTSPLLRVAGFREGLIAALATKAEIGMVQHRDSQSVQFKLNAGGSGNFGCFRPDLEAVPLGVNLPFRVCDSIAWQVSRVEGAPECELYWEQERRDRAVEACTVYLKRYGDRFTAEVQPGENDFPFKKAHLAFPRLDRPTTLGDVREGRAIFSLEGQGEARLATVPVLPIKARWTTLKDYPFDRPMGDGKVHREYQQDGWIWQAEEVRKGDRWERSYGFVGPHVIGRVPAAELELDPGPVYRGWGQLTSGLDARIERVEPPPNTYQPAQPIRVTLKIRNRRGVENTAPGEYLHRGDDGRPALRRGVKFAVFYTAPSLSSQVPPQGKPAEELKPKRTDRFVPDNSTRSLAPFEVIEAIPLDMSEWFDLTRAGSYRAHVVFAADSGVGEGTSTDWYFVVGNVGRPIP